jgi:hypothetical protein
MMDQVEKKVQKEVDEKRKLRKLEDDEEYDYITVPPDGGFGWVVLVACFVSYYLEFILYSTTYRFLSLLI